jgi:starch synthase
MSDRLCIYHVASEMAPFVKTGGLADVVSALPKALAAQGHEVHVAIPGYRSAIKKAEKFGIEWSTVPMTIEAGGIDHRIGIGSFLWEDVHVHLLACNELFDREGIYGPSPVNDFDDNARRFFVFCKAALATPGGLGFHPHVIHAHDWQAGLIPVLRERGFGRVLPAARTVFTIHNIAYQGAFWPGDLRLAGLDSALFNPFQLEHFGRLNCLKSGIVFADRVTTVSKRYAQEIQAPEVAYGLDAVIRGTAWKLDGITNGIDTDEWNPAKDPNLPATYSPADLSGKAACRAQLRKECSLIDNGACLMTVVSRLVEQKGIDLIIDAVEPYILAGRLQLAVLGSGDLALENRLSYLQRKHPGWVYVWYGYNEPLSHRFIAGGDAFLMPSRTEPCGLTQMYALRYGTLPIVRHTGGLADTVTDVTTGGNGFSFGPVDIGHFSSVIDRACGLYHHFPSEWEAAMRRAMACDNSWNRVAGDYERVYRSLCIPG